MATKGILALVIPALLNVAPPDPGRADHVAGSLIRLDTDGAWCWFQDERAIVHDGRLLVGSVSGGSRAPDRRGDVNVIVHDLAGGATTIVELHDRLELDDHNVPALLALPDGRVLAVYARHGTDNFVRTRATVSSDDLLTWTAERTREIRFSAGRGVTYSNLYRLAGENDGRGRLYNVFRGDGWDPQVIASDDDGASWTQLGALIGGAGRPYVRYASNDHDRIHFVCTEQHPRDFDNSIYHGYYHAGAVRTSDGTPVGSLGDASLRPESLTRLFTGDANNVAWCSNIELDAAGHPCVVYSVQKNSAGLPTGRGGDDCRYRYARWDGSRWHDHEVAYAGQRLYPREDDYTGLICIDPADTSVVYLSTNADPRAGAPLVSAGDGRRHYEIYRAVTADGGATWTFAALTSDSTVDNLRPMMPAGAEPSILLWLRGRYETYTRFDQAVVGLIDPDSHGTTEAQRHGD